MLRGNTPGFIFNVLIEMVRNDLSVHRWSSVRASYAVCNLTGKVVLIKPLRLEIPRDADMSI